MQTSTAAYGTIIGSNDITYAVRVTITWPAAVPAAYADASLVVSGLRLDRSLATDMPPGTRLVTGYPAAQLDMTLAGLLDQGDETKSIAWLMGQYRATSPLYRQDARGLAVSADVGVITGTAGISAPFEGVEFIRIFTGVIDGYTCDEAAGTVAVVCLDYRAKLRSTPSLPSFVGDAPTFGGSTFIHPGLTALWPLDNLLRQNHIYSGPPPRTGCIYYVSTHGSLWPEVGIVNPARLNLYSTYDTLNPPARPPVWVPGLFAGQVSPESHVGAMANAPLSTGASLVAEGWVKTDAVARSQLLIISIQNGVNTNNSNVSISLDSDATGHVRVGLVSIQRGTSGAVTVGPTAYSAAGTGWHQVTAWVSFTGASTATVQVWLDGIVQASMPVTGITAWVEDADQVDLNSIRPIDTWQVTSGEVTPTPVVHTPTAVLDASLNTLTTIPDVGGHDPWNTIQAIAQAEGGVAGFDELGAFRFRNRASIQSSQPARTIDASHGLISLVVATSFVDYANHLQVPVNALTVGLPIWVWTAGDVPVIPAHGTWVQFVTTDNPVVALATTDSGLMPAGGVPDGTTRWRAAHRLDGTGGAVTTGISVTAVQLSPNRIKITVTNANAYTVYLCSPTGAGYPAASDGQASLVLGGQFVSPIGVAGDASSSNATAVGQGYLADAQWPPLVPDGGAVTNPRGEHLLALPANDWLQNIDNGNTLAAALLSDLCSRRPQWTAHIVYDPRLQLADRVIITDADVTGLSVEHAILTGIRPDLATFTADVDLRPVGAPGGWMLNQSGRSELNSTIYI